MIRRCPAPKNDNNHPATILSTLLTASSSVLAVNYPIGYCYYPAPLTDEEPQFPRLETNCRDVEKVNGVSVGKQEGLGYKEGMNDDREHGLIDYFCCGAQWLFSVRQHISVKMRATPHFWLSTFRCHPPAPTGVLVRTKLGAVIYVCFCARSSRSPYPLYCSLWHHLFLPIGIPCVNLVSSRRW